MDRKADGRQIPTNQLDDIACSKCGMSDLDTGFECNNCGHDMLSEIEQKHPAAFPSPDRTQ